jgi:predicted outer membrane repeat protein
MIPSQITIARSVVAIGVLAFLFIASLAPPAAHGALIIIQNTSDSGPGSLRQAIMDAAPQTSISFNPALAGQTISLSSALIVDKQMEIAGPTPPAQRIKLTTHGLDTIMKVSALTNIHDIDFTNGAGENGGALEITNYTQLFNATISNSHATNGGGIYVAPNASFILDDALVLDNTASGDGGGLFAGDSAVLDINTVSFTGNRADGRGGGIFADMHSSLTIQGGDVSGNVAETGGGIYNDGNTGYYGNITSNGATADGGGVAVNSGLFVLNISTLASNTADNQGGAIMAQPGTEINLISTTISNNGAPQGGGIFRAGGLLTTKATIIADQASGHDCEVQAGSTIVSYGYNLTSDNSCGLVDPTDIPSGFANLGPLVATAPGTTLTMEPLEGSDAINRIPLSVFDCDSHLYIDQRGVQRPQGPTCDIGAVEVKGATANRIWGNNLCDGTIGSDDAIAMLFYVGGAPWQHSNGCPSVGSLISVSGQFDYGFWADVNCDGTINGIDIVNVLRAALLLSTQQGQQCPAIGDHVPVIG